MGIRSGFLEEAASQQGQGDCGREEQEAEVRCVCHNTWGKGKILDGVLLLLL